MGRTKSKGDAPKLPEGAIWKGNPILIPFLVPVDELREDAANARSHPKRSIDAIASSYGEFGQQKWIVCDLELTVRDGNGQYVAAAKVLGWTHVAAVPSNLEGIELTRYALAVNRSPELSEWDYKTLVGMLRGIESAGGDIRSLGWSDHEIDPILNAEWSPPACDDFEADTIADEAAGGPADDAVDPIALTRDEREAFEAARAEVLASTGGPLTDGQVVKLLSEWHLDPTRRPPQH